MATQKSSPHSDRFAESAWADHASMGEVHYRVLGPVAVLTGAQPIDLGGKRQKTVLALLLANANDTVSQEHLVDALWIGGPPASGVRTLQSYISHLRRALGGVIVRDGEGYVLKVAPERIDAMRFRALVDEARPRVESDCEAASELLRQALGLWTGLPYGDLGFEEALVIEANRLREERLEAEELRLVADLACGRHSQALAEIEALVAEHPYRESLVRSNMLALYRSGRQVDSLRVFADLRDRLRDDLGVDPSPELQDLEMRILNHDASLEHLERLRRGTLPERYSSFVGRSADAHRLESALAESRLVTIAGPGGIGKSSLAIEFLRSTRSSRSLYVNLEAVGEGDVLPSIATACGVGLALSNDPLDSLCLALSVESPVLLLDGCEKVLDHLVGIVDRILASVEDLVILVTSREPLFIPGETVLYLNPLAESESERLFVDRLENDRALSGADMEYIQTICTQLDGVPLAIELAASRARRIPLVAVVRRLDDQMGLLRERRGTRGRHVSIVATLDWGYETLSPDAQRSFRALAVFRAEFGPEAASQVLGVDSADGTLAELQDVSLLIAVDEGRFRMLEPIRQYAESQLEAAGEYSEVRENHANWLVDFAQVAGDSQWSRDKWADARSNIRQRMPEVIDTMHWSLTRSNGAHAVKILAHLGNALTILGEAGRIQELASRCLEFGQSVEPIELAQATAVCAWINASWGDHEGALRLIGEAEEIARGLSDDWTQFVVLGRKSAIMLEYPESDEAGHRVALELWDRAVRHGARARLDPPLPVWNACWARYLLGDFATAQRQAHRIVEDGAGGGGPAFLLAELALRRGAFDEARFWSSAAMEAGADQLSFLANPTTTFAKCAVFEEVA